MSTWFIYNIIMIFIGFFIDLLIGDPQWLPHPVVGIGKIANLLDTKFNRGNLLSGFIATTSLLTLIFLFTSVILFVSYKYNLYLYLILGSLTIYFTIALKSLLRAGLMVMRPLKRNNLNLARKKVAEIVGRDTENMSQEEVIRATIESLAENFIDGFFAPVFWAIIAGPVGAIIYRAINTLDSMWGYKNSRYFYFGRWAARCDDVVNWLPARLGGVFLILAGTLLRLNFRRALVTWLQDASKHPSPNSGHPEAVVAGLLGIQLGGLNYYEGQPQWRATMGEKLRDMVPNDIICISKILIVASLLTIIFAGFLNIVLILGI